MTEEQRLSTSDIAAAGDQRTDPTRDRPAPDRIEHTAQQRPGDAPSQTVDEPPVPLFSEEEHAGYRTRWSGIQTGFVDEPRNAVKEADALVAEVMKRLADVFAEERRQLETHWEQSDRISTEELRIAMRRYRSFFERLLAV
jgi:hypothetical protein